MAGSAKWRPGPGTADGSKEPPGPSAPSATGSAGTGGAGAAGSSGGESSAGGAQGEPEPIEYTFNTETSVGAPAADGSRVVTQQRYLVPTEGAHEAMPGGTVDVPAGAGGGGVHGASVIACKRHIPGSERLASACLHLPSACAGRSVLHVIVTTDVVGGCCSQQPATHVGAGMPACSL